MDFPQAELSFLGLFLVVIFIAKWLYNATTSYNTFTEIEQNNNLALAVSISGFLIAVTMIYVAVLQGPSKGLLTDLLNVSLYAFTGLGLLLITRVFSDKLLLPRFCNKEQIVTHQNLGVGIAQFASYISAGLIIAGALMGEGNFTSAIVFYLLAQLVLLIASKLYDALTHFDLQHELEKHNMAAAVSFAATKIATGIILFHALRGGLESWSQSITLFFVDALIALVLLPVVRLLTDLVLMPGVRVNKAIAEGNTAVSLIEGSVAVSVALAIFYTL
ncbi:DUF350 domain-containing protein [Pseudoalteromonas rubra]|uniref:DUF350 domain-containing protein n=1 Tax=Pseudoalteromonas rubra TaxID=43658 RepID=A0A0U3IAR9_9GAMM|nr:DUF350 domain-containing protein [Pseudoalteromonas rubra]ALU45183.1 hypothetical protein AT705_19665 [Pseudoalteromonas rubra]